MFLFKALGFTLNLFLPKGILAPFQVSHSDKIMAVDLDSIASKESMRTKPSHLPLLSLDRSVQLFPAHLTRLATFVIDAPDLTCSQLMPLSDHSNTHTKDMSQRTGQSTAPKGSNSNVFPSFIQVSKEFITPYFLHPNMFHLISKHIPLWERRH